MTKPPLSSSPTCREILSRGTPLIDVRAPVEFATGAFPAAVNLPLLLDDERKRVGTTYRQSGKQAAIILGHDLVKGDTKRERVHAWLEFARQNENALVCCARGGLRSQISAEWLAEAGRPTERVHGGFKALRNEALAVLEDAAQTRDWLVLGGKTGCGKTVLLSDVAEHLDFEGAANHRGSSFGGLATPQPSQVSFENQLAVDLLSHRDTRLVVEDEGRNLGKLAIPEPMVARMRKAPVVVVEVPFAQRVANIEREYVVEALDAGESADELCARYQAALLRLRKRLGDERWRQQRDLMDRGFASGDHDVHRQWIGGLLNHYYDPMYDYQLDNKRERVEFSGTVDQVRDYLRTR